MRIFTYLITYGAAFGLAAIVGCSGDLESEQTTDAQTDSQVDSHSDIAWDTLEAGNDTKDNADAKDSTEVTDGGVFEALDATDANQRNTDANAQKITQTINATNNKIARMVADGKTNNKPHFQALLDSADKYDHTTIHIAAGEYAFSGRVLMRSNVTIQFAKGAKFISKDRVNFSYYSTEPGYDSGVHDVTWNDAYFSGNGTSSVAGSMVHAKNITYNNATWHRAQGRGDHLLDIMGCSYIKVNSPKVIGTTKAYADDKESFHKESFQISYATRGSLGNDSLDATPKVFDGLPSHHVTIQNGQFTPAYDGSGKVIAFAPTPVGEHGNVSKMQIRDIVIKNNHIIDPFPASASNGGKKARGVIHFMSSKNIIIENNTFEYKKAAANDYVITLESTARKENILPIENVAIRNNTFKNISVNKAYILAESLPGKHGIVPINKLTITDNTAFVPDPNHHKPFFEANDINNITSLTISNNVFKKSSP